MFTKLPFFRWLALFALALAAPTKAELPPLLPLADYGKLPDIERIALSNDGERIAAVMRIAGERVVILLTSKLETIRMMKLGDAKVRSLEWAGNDYVLLVVSRTETLGPDYVQSQNEFFNAFILPADKLTEQRMVFGHDPSMLNAIFGQYGTRQIDGRWKVYYSGVQRKKGARGYYIGNTGTSLYEIDVATGKSEQVAASGSIGEGTGRLLGTDGKVAATLAIDIRTGFWTIKAPGGLELASGVADKGEVGFVGLGRNGDTLIYMAKPDGEDSRIWYEVPLDGHAAPTQFANADEIDRTYFDRNNGELIGLVREDGDGRPEFFDPAKEKAVTEIYKAFPGSRITLADWSPDFAHVLVRTSGPGDSGTWYLVDMGQMRARAIGYEREAIGPEYVGPISVFRYKAQDGLDLSGILTLPPGVEAKNLPIVMLPHGGPHAHDVKTFDWWAQAFASRGYAVFQPNFRGSTNRDLAFMEAGFGQWGKAMQTDISDAITALADKGIVDPTRACIMGASYGGYAALAGVTLQHGIYRCSVAVAGVADVGMLFNSERYDNGRTGLLRRSLEEEFGPKKEFDSISPRKHAAEADAPILLIHGRDDTVVPFEQSLAMADALKDADKPYEFVVLKEEDHWLSRSPSRLQMLEEAMAFVEKYNPPD